MSNREPIKPDVSLETEPKVRVEVFSRGKSEERNEDCFGGSSTSFVLADGATDKSGRRYDGKTGGELVSGLVVKECLASELTGAELVEDLNTKVAELYRKLGIENDTKNALYRFTCSVVCVRVLKNRVVVTSLGDVGFRINGEAVYQDIKQIDIDNAEERARYIQETGDLAGSRKHIMPFLLGQFEYQNSKDHSLGYGAIDGTHTPQKEVKVFEFDAKDIRTIEIFSDGYFAIPKEVTIDAWERSNEEVEQEDPYKCKKYKSTKEKDDRTVSILAFDKVGSH